MSKIIGIRIKSQRKAGGDFPEKSNSGQTSNQGSLLIKGGDEEEGKSRDLGTQPYFLIGHIWRHGQGGGIGRKEDPSRDQSIPT